MVDGMGVPFVPWGTAVEHFTVWSQAWGGCMPGCRVISAAAGIIRYTKDIQEDSMGMVMEMEPFITVIIYLLPAFEALYLRPV